jgi:hypothetical protein
VDVGSCVASGYALLCKNTTGTEFGVAFKLDKAGNDRYVAYARSVGDCSTCTGTKAVKAGLKVTVKGTYETTDAEKYRTLAVTELGAESVGCAGFVGETSVPNEKCKLGWALLTGLVALGGLALI